MKSLAHPGYSWKNAHWFALAIFLCATPAFSQTCLTTDDMDAPTRSALQAAGSRYFDMVARGDAASLKQNSIPSVANDFSGIESNIKDSQPTLVGSPPTARPPFLLKAEGTAPLPRAEFLCG